MKNKYFKDLQKMIISIVFLLFITVLYIIVLSNCILNRNVFALIIISIITLFPVIYYIIAIIECKNNYILFDHDKFCFYRKSRIYKTINWNQIERVELIYEFRNHYIMIYLFNDYEKIVYRKKIEETLKYYGHIKIDK